MYHAESCQEDFLVLTGTCLVIEEEERELHTWDFVHCPAALTMCSSARGHVACACCS